MKKHGLLKVLGIMFLLLIIVSYIVPGSNDTINRIGLADPLINYFAIVMQYFSYIVLFVLIIGGFYGVLNKLPGYKKLLDKIVTGVKPYSKKIIFLIIILFAVISSLTGMNIQLLVFVPFVVSIILLLGYDKLVAITSTIVSIMVGYIGGVFVNFMSPNTNAVTTFEQFAGEEQLFGNTFPKLLLLFAGITLLIYFVNKHIVAVENKKVKYDLTDDSELLISEVTKNYKHISTWPIITAFAVIFVIMVLGMVPWNALFEITVFNDFHTWLTGLTIKEFAVFPTVISSNLPAFGEWATSNPWYSYLYTDLLVLFVTFVVVLISRVKINDALDGFVEGCKKALPAAILISISYNVLVCGYNNGLVSNLISNSTFNYGTSSLLAALGCLINCDLFYTANSTFVPIVNIITDESIYGTVAILLQGIYGIVALVGPTSLILIFGLSYYDIPYTTWLKYIWRFILGLIILLALVTCLVALL